MYSQKKKIPLLLALCTTLCITKMYWWGETKKMSPKLVNQRLPDVW